MIIVIARGLNDKSRLSGGSYAGYRQPTLRP
jgi:hypothetical protein